jgi:hypothetical protein
MRCARCDQEGKKFRMLPSRKRKEFLEPYCPACQLLEKYDESKRQKEKKA